MSTLANSFMQGANFVRQGEQDHFNKKRIIAQDERQLAMDERTMSRQDAQDKRQLEMDKHQLEQRDIQNKGNTLRNQLTEAELGEFNANKENRATLTKLSVENAQAQSEAGKTADTRNTTQWEQSQADRKQTQEQALKAKNRAWLSENSQAEYYNAQQGKGISPEFYERSKGTAFDLSKVLDPEYVQALDFMSAALRPDDKRASPDSPVFLQAFNKVMYDEMNAGIEGSKHPKTGSKAVNKEVISVHPVQGKPGEFYANLKITYEDGSFMEAPMTQGRTGEAGDDDLKTIAVGDLVEQVNMREAYAKMWSDPKLIGEVQKYHEYQRQQANAGKKQDYKGKSTWKGQTIHTEELQKQFDQNHKDIRFASDSEGNYVPLYDFEQYAWTQGDADKQEALKITIEHNRKMLADGRRADELLTVQNVWAKQFGGQSGEGGAVDPNAGTLQHIKAGEVDKGKSNKTGKSTLPDSPDEASEPDVLIKDEEYKVMNGKTRTRKVEVPKYLIKGVPQNGGQSYKTVRTLNPEYVELLKQQQQKI